LFISTSIYYYYIEKRIRETADEHE